VQQALTGWLKSHTLLYPFVLFLLSALFSIYSQDIKKFLHEWPRVKRRAHQDALRAATDRIELLTRLHNNTYELILYFATYGENLVFKAFVYGALLTLLSLLPHGKLEPVPLYVGMMVGAVFGAWRDVRPVLMQLNRYEHSIAELKQKLLRIKLEGSPADEQRQ
jgi:hypothetical protein